jgi:hypothetical protein
MTFDENIYRFEESYMPDNTLSNSQWRSSVYRTRRPSRFTPRQLVGMVAFGFIAVAVVLGGLVLAATR